MRQEPVQATNKTSSSADNDWSAMIQSAFLPGLSFANQAFAAERMLLERMLDSLGNPPLRIALWDGQEVTGLDESPVATMIIRDRGALLKLIANPEYWFGEMYVADRIGVEGDLVDFIETIYRSLPRVRNGKTVQGWLSPLSDARRNTLPRARRNIHHHYDIGNDFYKLWLDQDMVYTCGYFPDKAMELEQAQIAKMDHVCRKLQLRPGDQVVEAGCGWGTLALHMAGHYGAKVKAYNISREQIIFAREKARDLGLDGQVEFIEDDYRNVRGLFDAFVSVGMLEHVGAGHYHELGAVIQRSLRDSGRGLIHSIGRDYPSGMNPWIERRIFPGACPPSLSQMMQ
ncbi:MAG: cyclopropane-fatty-acyl-phospholipid synthase, partial [Proteobacteria bacterium]|nr:cyclopropane-fatty-acyl-phospholipid synthase [Pseudomonadota bacterium]